MSESYRALLLEQQDGGVAAHLRDLTVDDLPAGEVLIRVAYSSLNYKDGLALTNQGRIIRTFPFVAGIDLAGTVVESASPAVTVGDHVVVTGNGMGERHWGGFAQMARVPAEWIVKLPGDMSPIQAMTLGTAGFTAMQCLVALENHGMVPGGRDVLVTGASGGVGSVAVAILAKNGYRVVASTGKGSAEQYLRDLGAAEVIDRSQLSEPNKRPLESERWGGAIDSVGGHTLANVLKAMAYGTSVAACGLAGGGDLPSTVHPFILRGVNLLGIDSVAYPNAKRPYIWQRLANDMNPALLESVRQLVPLDDLTDFASEILAGNVKGRVVVDLGTEK